MPTPCAFTSTLILLAVELGYLALILLVVGSIRRSYSLQEDWWDRLDAVQDLNNLQRHLRVVRLLLIVYFPVFIVTVTAVPNVQLCEVDMINWLTRIGWIEAFVAWCGICRVNGVLVQVASEMQQRLVVQEDDDDNDNVQEQEMV
jgi:hypothetical protein